MKLLASVLATVCAAQAGVVVHPSATSEIRTSPGTQATQSQATSGTPAASQAIWPASPTNAQARTAARSSALEIGANALITDSAFTRLNFDEVISAASYAITATPEFLNSGSLIEFYLPPSYLEVESNLELPNNTMEVLLLANLEVCFRSVCTKEFFFQSIATASYNNQNFSTLLSGNPMLDLTALDNPQVSLTPSSDLFLRTYLVEFPDYAGSFDFGAVPVGESVEVRYQIQARAKGLAAFNHAIAAINDPFTVTTDPIRQGTPLSLTFTGSATESVPEPSTVLLSLTGLMAFAVRRMNHFR